MRKAVALLTTPPAVVRARMDEVFARVQGAWSARDLALATAYMSPKGRERLQAELDEMKGRPVFTLGTDGEVVSLSPLLAVDRRGIQGDALWLEVKATLVESKVRNADGVQVQAPTKEHFTEVWKLVRDARGNWVLDEILNDQRQIEALMERAVTVPA